MQRYKEMSEWRKRQLQGLITTKYLFTYGV